MPKLEAVICSAREAGGQAMPKSRERSTTERSDVLVSAVISTYLLTHLHHVLQRAEYGAVTDAEALDALQLLCQLEGIIPALETAHAFAWLDKLGERFAPGGLSPRRPSECVMAMARQGRRP